MAVKNFTGTLTGVGQSASVTCGDSADNNYIVAVQCVIAFGVSALYNIYVDGVRQYTFGFTSSSTQSRTVTSTSTSPVITVEFNRANPSDGYSIAITPLTVTYQTSSIPATPTINNVTNRSSNADSSLLLAFSAYSGGAPCAKRVLEVYNQVTGAFVKTVNLGNVISYICTGLAQYTSYNFKLKDYDTSGLSSGWSAVVTAATRSKPETPALTATVASATSVNLASSAFSNADGTAHKSTLWVITDVNTGQIVYNTRVYASLEAATISTLTALTDYKAVCNYQSAVSAESNYSAPVYFSTASYAAKKTRGGIGIASEENRITHGGIGIIDDPNTKITNGGIGIGDFKTMVTAGGIGIVDNSFVQDNNPSTTWINV